MKFNSMYQNPIQGKVGIYQTDIIPIALRQVIIQAE
jgi:hypothetical protein